MNETKEERDVDGKWCREKSEEFFDWTGSQPRSPCSWLASLEEWARREFTRAYNRTYPKKKDTTEVQQPSAD